MLTHTMMAFLYASALLSKLVYIFLFILNIYLLMYSLKISALQVELKYCKEPKTRLKIAFSIFRVAFVLHFSSMQTEYASDKHGQVQLKCYKFIFKLVARLIPIVEQFQAYKFCNGANASENGPCAVTSLSTKRASLCIVNLVYYTIYYILTSKTSRIRKTILKILLNFL